MPNSATWHPIPEPLPASVPANDAAPKDLRCGLWRARSSTLELTLIQAARHESPSQALRARVLKACGIR